MHNASQQSFGQLKNLTIFSDLITPISRDLSLTVVERSNIVNSVKSFVLFFEHAFRVLGIVGAFYRVLADVVCTLCSNSSILS